MNHSTFCKFCRLPITVQVDDAYAQHGDPFKLLKLACCDACGDVRVWRRLLESKLQKACYTLQMAGAGAQDEVKAKARAVLTRLTQDYARMIARWHKQQGMAWDEEAVNQLMEHPELWGQILRRLWKAYDASRKEAV